MPVSTADIQPCLPAEPPERGEYPLHREIYTAQEMPAMKAGAP